DRLAGGPRRPPRGGRDRLGPVLEPPSGLLRCLQRRLQLCERGGSRAALGPRIGFQQRLHAANIPLSSHVGGPMVAQSETICNTIRVCVEFSPGMVGSLSTGGFTAP